MVYHPARINFNNAQVQAAIAGRPFRVKADQLNSGDKTILLHPANYLNFKKAAMKGRGFTITISPAEILSTVESDMDGTGFFGDLWKKLKSGYSWVKKNIIDSDVYQSAIKPIVRQGVNAAITAANTAYPGSAVPLSAVANKIGNQTGAFGAPPVMRRSRLKGGSFRLN